MRVLVSIALAAALAACSTSTTEQIIGGADTATDGNADNTDGTDGTDGSADPWSFIPDGQDQVCATPFKYTGNNPTFYPFTGRSYDAPDNNSYSFSCTRCPTGYDFVAGKYRRYIDENPELPKADDESELWEFKGNAFINRIEAVDSADGQRKTVVAKGYYFCPDAGTLPFKTPDFWNVMLVYTEVDPPGAFGIEVGATDPCFLGFSIESGGDDILVGCNFLWDPKESAAQQDTYCRVGSMVQGRLCTDPTLDGK